MKSGQREKNGSNEVEHIKKFCSGEPSTSGRSPAAEAIFRALRELTLSESLYTSTLSESEAPIKAEPCGQRRLMARFRDTPSSGSTSTSGKTEP